MTVIPAPRGPIDKTSTRIDSLLDSGVAHGDFTARPAVWTPAGTTGEVTPSRGLRPGDHVLIYRSHGYWGLAPTNPDFTPRYAEWGLFTGRVRRALGITAPDGAETVMGVRKLDHSVIRRTFTLEEARQVSVHDFESGYSGMSCVRMVERPDGTGDACGEPVKSAIHDPAAYSAYATELKAELGKYTRREPPYDTPDALDLALECAFPSAPSELETMRDKVRGHLEAARMVYQVAYARGGTVAENRAIGAVDALTALAKDLGL